MAKRDFFDDNIEVKTKKNKKRGKKKSFFDDDSPSLFEEVQLELDLEKTNLLTPEVAEFVLMKYDKDYKKDNRDYFDSKKEMKRQFFSSLSYDLEYVIPWVLRNGFRQNPDNQKIKNAIYNQLAGKTGPAFIKYITKSYKNGEFEGFANIQFLPILLYEIISNINKQNRQLKAENPEAEVYDASDLYELSELILKPRIKKLVKKGIDENMAFDILSVIPSPEAMKFSGRFRVKMLFTLLYQYAEKQEVPFRKILKIVVTDEYNDDVIFYALRERKEKYQKFTDTQKSLFNSITEWVFDVMEDMDKTLIKDILKTYVKDRKRDESQGKDGNRRYFISSLPEDDYKRINKVVKEIISSDETAKKYL